MIWLSWHKSQHHQRRFRRLRQRDLRFRNWLLAEFQQRALAEADAAWQKLLTDGQVQWNSPQRRQFVAKLSGFASGGMVFAKDVYA